MSSLEERIEKLEDVYKKLKLELNHKTHPPHVNQVLDYIRKHAVATMDELREHFHLYGGNLSRFYNTLHEKQDEFVVVPGIGRTAKMIVAHLNEGKPTTFGAMAVHIFSQTRRERLIPLQKITETYNLNTEDAKQVYDAIIKLFEPRINYNKLITGKYETPIKRLY